LPYICHIYAIYLIRYMTYIWEINGHEIRFHSNPILILFSTKNVIRILFITGRDMKIRCSVFRVPLSVFRVHQKYESPFQIKPEIVEGIAFNFQGQYLKQIILILTKGNTYLQILNLIEK